ncbi:ferritin-like domain-containing protein [Hygrophoropsis aurantiaca]|uniref:Ferritin-like domain-containing protein n=1 Tax=Hygrophoropsis aurantiaca TaxID=72124 RepID=A0ACB8AR94_9AGAM|nr:ferritin-like domain-containing protein [Hygrophoropsis aurantiaca]
MHFLAHFALFLWLSLFQTTTALPVKRTSDSSDLVALQFANVLEQLESQFYTQALERFNASDFEAAGFASSQVPLQQFQQILGDESTHATTLESAIVALGGETISGCSFNFSSALTDVTTMAAVARLIENVGVSAYLGALPLLSDPVLATAAASIMTVEARHQTILNVLGGASAIPQAFDVPLNPSEILAIAGGFISGCDLGVSANPPLAISSSGPFQAGSVLSLNSTAINGTIPEDELFCQIIAGGLPVSISQPICQCSIPQGIDGPLIVFATNGNQSLLNNIQDAAVNTIVAGPTMIFVDTFQDALGQLVRPGLNSSSISNTTSTISVTTASFAAPTTVTLTSNFSPTSAMSSVTTTTSDTTSTALTSSITSTASSTSATSFNGIITTTLSLAQASSIIASAASAAPST